MTDFTAVGGVALMQGGETTWNFGMRFDGRQQHSILPLDVAAPNLSGRWDGNTAISHWLATKRYFKDKFLPAQRQTAGTCVSRGFAGAINVLQCVMGGLGRPVTYQNVSHAWAYGGARTLSGLLGSGDGAMGPDAMEWGRKYGVLTQPEAKDEDYYSDKVAVEYGRVGVPKSMFPMAADNLIGDIAMIQTPEQAADVIAGGGVITVASDRGFTMERDRYGVCRPSGTWHHQMYICAVMKLPNGAKVFGCGQSWGDNTPSGDLLEGCPDYVFGIEWDVAAYMFRQRGTVAATAFANWVPPDDGKIPWVF